MFGYAQFRPDFRSADIISESFPQSQLGSLGKSPHTLTQRFNSSIAVIKSCPPRPSIFKIGGSFCDRDFAGSSSLGNKQIVSNAAQVCSGGCVISVLKWTAKNPQESFLYEIFCRGRVASEGT
jgi:hypothetical protein